MISNSLYWQQFEEKELKLYDSKNRRFLKRGYLHFDPRIWFPEHKDEIKNYILDPKKVSNHSFYPFLQVTIETKRIRFDKEKRRRAKQIKKREISFAAHKDALIYSFYSSLLDTLYEKYAKSSPINTSSLAYRSLNKSNVHFAAEVFESIKVFAKEHGDTVAVALDVKSFFDTLNHDHLWRAWLKLLRIEAPELERLPEDQIKVFRSLTNFSSVRKDDVLSSLGITPKDLKQNWRNRFCSPEVFRDKIRKSKIVRKNTDSKGIPQGSPMSAVLSNIYMIEYDEAVCDMLSSFPMVYRRYCDDIIVICRAKDLQAVREQIYNFIRLYGLQIQEEKEDIIYFINGNGFLKSTSASGQHKKLQYLGFEFDGQRTFIRSSSMSKYHRKMKASVREVIKQSYGSRSQGERIFKRKLYNKYTHLGSRNFITYALQSAEVFGSATIKKQVSKHFKHLNSTIHQKRDKLELRLRAKGRYLKSMK